jgi:hypothetical protein
MTNTRHRVPEKKRRALTRGYDLVARDRLIALGHAPARSRSAHQKFLQRVEYQFLPHYFGSPPPWRLLLRMLSGERALPDFAVVGPIKSASSDLAVNLMLHPAIIPPLAKEFPWPDPEAWRVFYPTLPAKARHAKIHGAALSPFLAPYLHWMEVTYRFSRANPNAKIILTLRDPVERAYSHWKWEYFLAGKPSATSFPFLRTFAEYVAHALEVFPEYPMYTACGARLLDTGIYWKAVAYWMECFGRDRVLVLDTADYFRDRNVQLRKIYDFIGLPHHAVPDCLTKVNENPLTLPSPDEESLERLRAFYRPYNQKLWAVLGNEFDW